MPDGHKRTERRTRRSGTSLEGGSLIRSLERSEPRTLGWTESAGLGGRLVYRAFPLVDLETEINFLPGHSVICEDFWGKAGKRMPA